MSTTPAVSVVLPTFNRPQYLPDAVASIFAQTFRDWELLIADDGSGPETREYLRTLGGRPGIKVLWLPHTGIPAAVRNAALREASGEYVAFLDSDDMWEPEKLHRQIESLSTRRREWSYTGFTLVDDSGNPLTDVRGAKRCPALDGRILDPLLKEEALVVTPSVVARRELIERVGGYDEELRACEDYELWIRLAALSEVDFIDEPLVLVRRHKEHSFDDATCLESLRTTVEKVQRSRAVPHLDALLQKRRAKISAGLAMSHARCKRRFRTLAVLSQSAAYSWRHREWWMGAAAATVRAFAPAPALRQIDRYRRGRREGH